MVKEDSNWRNLLQDVIQSSLEVAEIVSPIVSNSSPEGNVPLGMLI